MAMGRGQKVVTTVLWGVLVLVMVGVVALWAQRGQSRGGGAAELPRLYPAPPFSLTDQDGRTVTSADLEGKVWAGMFVFTGCAADCPMMFDTFKALQDQTAGTGLRLVSFTLDPERDTPVVLKDYARRLGADGTRWSFLTGPKQVMYDTARAMKVAAEPAGAAGPITHADLLLLVDGNGQVRGFYRSSEKDALTRLAADAALLARE